MASACRKVPRVSLPVSLDHETLTSCEDYICTTVDDLFSAPSQTTFVDYKVLDVNNDNKEHPGAKIVESYPLSAIDPPAPNPAHIHEDLDKMDLSAVQKDAVRLAASRFRQPFLESGLRRGFLFGDGPGAGKTRIILATLYNEIKNGNDRHILLSLSNHLYKDIVAEFEKIAPADWVRTHIESALNIKKTMDLSNFKGILFMTYRHLRKSGESKIQTRSRETEKSSKNPKLDGGLEDNAARQVSSEVHKLSGMEIVEQFLIHEDDFSGVIALDESHVGKNALHNINVLRSKVGKKILELLKRYKNAKVVYCTATPASNSNHFGILSSLGIWGPEKYFKDFDKFYNSMSKWELSAAELVSLKLKQEGAMVCRQISYEGVEVSSEFVPSTKEPELYQETYNEFADMWREMVKDVRTICTYCKEETHAKIATFFSAMMNFFRAYIIHSKIDHLVEMIKREHDHGNAVVVGIQGTGESSYKAYARNYEKDFLISNSREIMKKFVKQHFCVPFGNKPGKNETRKRKREDNSSNNVSSPNVDVSSSTEASTMDVSSESEDEDEESNVDVPRRPSFSGETSGNVSTEDTRNHEEEENQDSIENLQANENPPANEYKRIKFQGVSFDCKDIKEVNDIRKYWLDKIKSIQNAPPNFLDEVQRRLSNLGIKVAEITGRKLFLKKEAGNDESGNVVDTMYHIRDRQLDIDEERLKFMSDEVQVAIISDAGSIGISLHSSNECENKRKRVHITVEMGWSAEKLYQQIGRTNRANQKHQPEYKFLLSNVYAEIRFTSIILGRLSTMSAFSCAQRFTPICDKLADQAQYDSNAGIRGIKAAWAYFCDQETTIPYEMVICNKSKVLEQLKSLGLKEYMEKTRSYGGEGRTLKRVVLTRIMNKLLGCSLDVQESFCKVWNFFMMHYQTIDNKPRGVVVIPRSKCVALFNVNGTDMLVKHQNQVELEVSDENLNNDSVSNPDANNDLIEHGPINLVPVKVYLGSTLRAVVNLHQAADVNDKVSGFYVDNGKIGHQRYFYLQNITPELTEIGRGITRSNLNKEATICILHQPHQPPIDMNMDQVLEFKQKMNMFPGLIRTELWDGQADDLMYRCIHKRCLHDCPSPNCPIGRRMEVKYLVEGDVWAIWEDIVATLKDEDPVVAVIQGHDYDAKAANVEDRLKPNTRFGIVIPNGSRMELKHRVLGDFICPLGE